MAEFFEVGKTYRHSSEHGSEGIFLVEYVGVAPTEFEHHAETLGVAFGWRGYFDQDGKWVGDGCYTTPDFAGWEELPTGYSFTENP